MNRTSSNASDVFSSYLSPLSSKGEPSKDHKKCSLPPTLPRKELLKIDENSSIKSSEGADDNGGNKNVSGDPKDKLDISSTSKGIDEFSSTFDPRKFNASYNETMKPPHYKEIHAKTNHMANGLKVEGTPNYERQQSPPSATGEANIPNLGFTGNSKSSVRNRSHRVSSIRDLVNIRNRIKTQTTQLNSVTSERYVYLDRGNTWCLRISFLICIICIIILFILVSHITARLTSLEGT